MRTLASALSPIAADLTDAPRVYVDANVPLGVVSCHGSSRVPLPCATLAPPFAGRPDQSKEHRSA